MSPTMEDVGQNTPSQKIRKIQVEPGKPPSRAWETPMRRKVPDITSFTVRKNNFSTIASRQEIDTEELPEIRHRNKSVLHNHSVNAENKMPTTVHLKSFGTPNVLSPNMNKSRMNYQEPLLNPNTSKNIQKLKFTNTNNKFDNKRHKKIKSWTRY